MQLADVIDAVRQHWRTSVAILLVTVVGVAAFLFTRDDLTVEKRWRVDTEMVVPVPGQRGEEPEGVPVRLVRSPANQATSPDLLEVVLERAGVPEAERDDVSFSARLPAESDVLVLSVVADDEERAMDVATYWRRNFTNSRANSVSDAAEDRRERARESIADLREAVAEVEASLQAVDPALFAVITAQPTPAAADEGDDAAVAVAVPAGTSPDAALLVAERRALLNRIRSFEADYARARLEVMLPQSFVSVLGTRAPVEVESDEGSPLLPAAGILGVGMLLAVAVPVAQVRLDRSIRRARQAESAFGSPVLASIPGANRSSARALAAPGTRSAAAYRALAATSLATDRLPRAIVVTAPTGTAQDRVAANYAAALAGLGLRVALVATAARQGWYMGDGDGDGNGDGALPAADRPGLGPLTFPELLERAHRGQLNGAVTQRLARTQVANLAILPPGPEDGELDLNGLPPLLEALSNEGIDVTVIAGPPLLDDPDATIFAWITRSVLWVAAVGELTEPDAEDATARLARTGATAFGVVLVEGKT